MNRRVRLFKVRLTARDERREEHGQAIVLLAIMLAALLGLCALVIDGGNLFVEHRGTQNAADAAALAGATIMVQNVGDPGSQSAGDVLDAMQATYLANDASMVSAQFVRYDRSIIGNVSGYSDIPADAGGVTTKGSRSFQTYLASIANIPTMTAGASATALAGVLEGGCADDCAFLPVAVPVQITLCDGTNRSIRIGTEWVNIPLETAYSDDGVGNWEAIVPLCSNGPGDVGWLDFGELADEQNVTCRNNLPGWIYDPAYDGPCPVEMDVPGWYHAETGNTNSVQDELENYIGEVVMIPLFDGTCRVDPSPGDCAEAGNGNNFWYHIPKIAAFLIDDVYVGGNNHPECNQTPGYPLVGGNGSTGCLKGWFIDLVSLGNVGDGSGSGGDPSVLGVQLVPNP